MTCGMSCARVVVCACPMRWLCGLCVFGSPLSASLCLVVGFGLSGGVSDCYRGV